MFVVSGQNDRNIDSTVHECSMALGSCSLRYFIEVGNQPDAIYVLGTPQGTCEPFQPLVTVVAFCTSCLCCTIPSCGTWTIKLL